MAVSSPAKSGALLLGTGPVTADSARLGPYAKGFRTAALLSGNADFTDSIGRSGALSSVFLAPEALVAESCAEEKLASSGLSVPAATFGP